MPTPAPPSPPHPGSQPVPAVVHSALDALGAPESARGDMSAVTGWAEADLRIAVLCGGAPQVTYGTDGPVFGEARTGRIRHRVQIDPHTGTVAAANSNESEREKIEAVHWLWSLSTGAREAPACAQLQERLAQAIGTEERVGATFGWGWDRAARFAAVRTVVRAVQYHDHGLVLAECQGWLRLGAPVRHVQMVARTAHRQGVAVADFSEPLIWAVERRPVLSPVELARVLLNEFRAGDRTPGARRRSVG